MYNKLSMHKFSPNLLLLLFLTFWLFLTAITIPEYGVTWDEPLYFRAVKAYSDWFGLIFSGNWNTAFDAKTVDSYWQYNSQHPPLTKLISAVTYTITHHWFEEITAFRLAELIWYGLLLLLVYWISKNIYGRNVAWVAMLSTALMPRLFADAHLLELDLPLAVVWLFTVYAFYRGIDDKDEVSSTKDEPHNGMTNNQIQMSNKPGEKKIFKDLRLKDLFGFWILDFGFKRSVSWSVICGLAFGLALLTKVIAVFIIIPLLLWAQIFQRNKYTNNLFCMVTIGPIIFILFWPWLWHNTFTRILDYFAFFFLMESPLKTFYFNQAYSSTPWHYPLVMTLVTIPVGILFFALFGIFRCFISDLKSTISKNPFSVLLLFNIGFFILFFALPGTLAIDGVRYFLPIFPMLAIFAGLGFNHAVEVLSTKYKVRSNSNRPSSLVPRLSSYCLLPTAYCLLPTAICLLVFLLPLISIGYYHPYQLSYFNEFIGGIRGATKLGFETTYWGEVIGQNQIDWINNNIPFNAKVKILPVYPAKNAPIEALSFYPDVVFYYQQRGILRPDINFFASPPYDYLFLVTRQGLFTSFDWQLYKERQPIYQTSLSGVQLFGIYKLD